MNTKFYLLPVLLLLSVLSSCNNDSLDESIEPEDNTIDVTDNSNPDVIPAPIPVGFEFSIVGNMDNSDPQTKQGDRSTSLYTARESSNTRKLKTSLKMEYLPISKKSSIGLPIMKMTATEPGKGTGSNDNSENYAHFVLDMRSHMSTGTGNISNYIENWEPLKFNRVVGQIGVPKNMVITDTHKQQWQVGSYFSSHPHGKAFSSKEKDGSHGYYYYALPSVNNDLGGGRNAWLTFVIDDKPNHFRGESGATETKIEEKWPLAVNKSRNWLDANNRFYQQMDGNLNAFPHPDGKGSEVSFYFSQYAAFHIPNEYNESKSKVRNMIATYHEDNEIAWIGFNSNKLITTGNYEARISNTSFHNKGWDDTQSVSMGNIEDLGVSSYNTSRISAKIPANNIGEGAWYFIAVKHSGTNYFREIRIPAKNNF